MTKKLSIIVLVVGSTLLAACGTTSSSTETVSKEQFQELKQVVYAQATQLASLATHMPTSTPNPTTTPTPTAPTETPTPTPTEHASQQSATPEGQTTPAANPPAPICGVIHDYPLKYLNEVSTSKDGFLHVEYWVGGNTPEYETILPGGRYTLRISFAGGHVWEYRGCSFEQVKSQVDSHVARRLANKARNGGYVDWESTGYFEPVK